MITVFRRALRACIWSFFMTACMGSTAFGAGGLTVSSALPRGEVTELTQITVGFSEPMRALGVTEERKESVPLMLAASGGPLPAGTYRWLDPSTLAYIFNERVALPLVINARVPAGTRSLNGKTLDGDVTWSTATPPLEISLGNSPGATLSRTKAVISLEANYPLNLKILRDRVRLSVGGKNLAYAVSRPDIAGWSQGRQSRWIYNLAPKGALPPNSTLAVTVASGLTTQNGGLAAGKMSFSLPTFESLRVEEWRTGSGRGKTMPPENCLSVRFNNAVRFRDLLAHLTVSPKASLPRGFDPKASWESTGFCLPYQWQPGTRYTVAVTSGLRDRMGTGLAKTSSFTFTTGDYRPILYMDGGEKVLEAPLGGLLPINTRNTGTVSVRLRYIPWSRDAYAIYGKGEGFDDAFLKAGDARETLAVLDSKGRENLTLRQMVNIPAKLGLAGPGDLRGPVFVSVLPEDRNLPDQNPGERFRQKNLSAVLQVTDIAVTTRMGEKQGLAWITGITSGKPLAGAGVALVDANGKTLWEGTSSDRGIVRLPGYANLSGTPRFCVATNGGDISVLDMAAQGLPKDRAAFSENKKASRSCAAFMLTQLPLYQPGQDVRFVIYTREHTDSPGGRAREFAAWRPLAGEEVTVTVTDPRGRAVHTQKGRTNAFGSVSGVFSLPDDANLGHYAARVTPKKMERDIFAQGFVVASFRPPDFKVDITAPASAPNPPASAAPLTAPLEAAYFSGTSLPLAKAELAVIQVNDNVAPARLNGYKTGPDVFLPRWSFPGYRAGSPRTVATLHAILDDAGKTAFTIPRVTTEEGLAARIALTGTVTDASGLTTQGQSTFVLHPSASYVGVRAPFIAIRDQDATVELKAATWDDKPLAHAAVTLTAERRLDADKHETVWEKRLTLTREEGERFTVTFPKSGLYTLSARIRDDSGRENVTRSLVRVPGGDLAWSQGRGEELECLVEEKEYAPGETARVVLRNPFARDTAYALVTIERQSVMRTIMKEVAGPSPVIDIPLREEDAPYVHASVTLVRGRTAPPPAPETVISGSNAEDAGAPAMRHGTLTLRMSRADPGLAAVVTTDSDAYLPGGKVSASVSVTDTSGKPRRAQVTLLAVDERVLRAAGERIWHDPSRAFPDRFPGGVYDAATLRLLLNLGRQSGTLYARNAILSQAAAPMADSAMEMNAAPGGGAEESITLRRDFSPTAYWLAEGETDGQGKLAVSFTLPDTVTSYRIVAVAADKGEAFASGETRIRATKPLQLLSAMPRFVTNGDSLEARILVQNNGTDAGTATITAQASGAVLAETGKTLTLAAGGSAVATFPMSITGEEAERTSGDGKGRVTLRVAGVMGKDRDAAEFVLPVMPARPLTTVAAAGVLSEGGSISLPMTTPADLDARSGLEVTLAASPTAGAPLAAKQILEYPWDCLEQRTSRAWAKILRLKHGSLLGLAPDVNDRDSIRDIMATIPKFQRQDGGFGLWPGMIRSDYYLTAYIQLVAEEARPLDITLPPDVSDKAYAMLAKGLEDLAAGQSEAEASPEALALGLYLVAARDPAKAAPLYPATEALCRKTGANPLAWASLILALDRLPSLPGRDATRSGLVESLEKSAAVTPTQLHFGSDLPYGYWKTMGSSLRDNAAVLAAMAKTKLPYPRLEALANWVGQSLGDRRSLSTQEAVFGVWGVAEYLTMSGGEAPTSVKAVWTEGESFARTFAKRSAAPATWTIPAERLDGGSSPNLAITAEKGQPYWTARLAYASRALPVKAENAGFTLVRKTGGKTTWKMGETVTVEVTLTVPQTRRHVLLFDPFPAGLEPLHATRADLADGEKPYQPPWQWQETREDGMLLYAETVNPGVYTYTYTLRAAAPGTFVQRPSRVEEMYTPEVFGSTADGRVTVTP